VQFQVFVDESRPAQAIVDILNNDFTELTFNETAGSHLVSRPEYWRDYVIRLSEEQDIDTRAKIMEEFKHQDNYVLVTDDMAARGLDVPTLTHVVHFDVPQDPLVYLHRSGRTGRVGRDGTVVTLLSPEEEFVAKKLMNSLNIEMTPYAPNNKAASKSPHQNKQAAAKTRTRTEST
jgi:superfamily II DNA/RNA helicase